MLLKEIRIDTVFGTVLVQAEKSNCLKRPSRNLQNPEGAPLFHKNPP